MKDLHTLVAERTQELNKTHLATLNLLEDLSKENEARRKSEKAMRESEEKYRAIFENVQDVFYQIDLSGIVKDISPSIKHFSQFTREEIIGHPVQNIYYDYEDRDSLIDELLIKKELRDYEVRLKN